MLLWSCCYVTMWGDKRSFFFFFFRYCTVSHHCTIRFMIREVRQCIMYKLKKLIVFNYVKFEKREKDSKYWISIVGANMAEVLAVTAGVSLLMDRDIVPYAISIAPLVCCNYFEKMSKSCRRCCCCHCWLLLLCVCVFFAFCCFLDWSIYLCVKKCCRLLGISFSNH